MLWSVGLPCAPPEIRPTMKPTKTLLIGMIGFCCSQLSSYADQNWDGDSYVGDFKENTNWYSNNQPGWGSGNLYFSYRNNSSQTSIFYNYDGWVSTNNIVWESTFNASLTWDGNDKGINFNQKLENKSSHTQTIGTMKLSAAKNGAAQIELNPVNGDLILNGEVYNDNSKPYHVYGSNSKTLTLNTTLGVGGSATSVSFTINENSTVVINSNQNYMGVTDVKAGQLFINGDNSSATGTVTVDLGAILAGNGTVGGATTIYGTHDVSNSGSDRTQNFKSTLTYNSGSIFSWDLDLQSNSYDKVVVDGELRKGTGTSIFQIVLGTGDPFNDPFWNTNQSWNDIFTKGSGGDSLASIFTTFNGIDVAPNGVVTDQGHFSFSGDTLNWTAVPETSNLLAGVLLGAGLLRRKRVSR